MKAKSILVVLVVAILLIACQKTAVEPLRLVIHPSESASLTREHWEPVTEYLSEGLGQEVELFIVTEYAGAIEAMKYGHADIATFSGAGYIQALEQGAKIDVVAKEFKTDTGSPGYYSLLIALSDTDVTDLNALTLAFTKVGSTSGYFVPLMYLESQGIEPKEVLYAGSHQAVILAVQNGSVDVGAVASHRLVEAVENGVLKEGEFIVLWKSALIPSAPVVVQSALPQATKDKIVELFLDMPEELIAPRGVKVSKFVGANDADYDPIRELMQFKGK